MVKGICRYLNNGSKCCKEQTRGFYNSSHGVTTIPANANRLFLNLVLLFIEWLCIALTASDGFSAKNGHISNQTSELKR